MDFNIAVAAAWDSLCRGKSEDYGVKPGPGDGAVYTGGRGDNAEKRR